MTNQERIVNDVVPNVYNSIIETVKSNSDFDEKTNVLSEANMAKLRSFWHKYYGNVGNKILAATMSERNVEEVENMLNILSEKAGEKAVDVYEEIVKKVCSSKRIPRDIASKSTVICCENVGKRQIEPMQQTVSAIFEKQQLSEFEQTHIENERVANA